MAFYQEIEPAAFEAFTVTDVSPDFHGKELLLLDNGTINEVATGTAASGDLFSATLGYIPASAIGTKYKEVTAPAPLPQ